MYFKAIFDDDISLSTGPEAAKKHCWRMLLYRIPARIYRTGEIFGMQVEVPELSEHRSWSWQIDMPKDGLRDESDIVGYSQERAAI